MALTKPKQSSFDISAGSLTSAQIKALGIENASFADLAVTVDKANLAGVSYPGFEEDVALLGFKVASNGSLGKYNLVDQAVDAFEDADGVDASASTGETRDSDGKYYSGANIGSYTVSAFTSTGASTWTCPANTTEAEVLIVAGGGGGANGYYGGAGGAGGGGGGGGSPGGGTAGNQADSNGLTAHKGNGGNGVDATAYPGGGGGGAGGNGGNASASTGGTAGAGLANAFRTGSNVTYCAGGAGVPATDGLGAALNTPANTGNGGKAGGNNQLGGDGSNGIIVIRYAL